MDIKKLVNDKEFMEAYFYARRCHEYLNSIGSTPKVNPSNQGNENDLKKILQTRHGYNRNPCVKNDSYNIFSALNVISKETRHSAFLGELLDPFGRHGKGDLFLDLFCKQLSLKKPSPTVKMLEYYVSPKDFGEGRLDVYLPCVQHRDREIIIENKIYASDEKKQLERYHAAKPDAQLLYLTLDGNRASAESVGAMDETLYKCISYRDDILKWLESCKEKCASIQDFPLLCAIEAYVETVKTLVEPVWTKKEREKSVNFFLCDPIFLGVYGTLWENDQEIREYFADFVMDAFNHAAQKLNASVKIMPGKKLFEKEGGVIFDFDDVKDYSIAIKYNDKTYNKAFYGIINKSGKSIPSDTLKSLFEGYFYQKDESAKNSTCLLGASWNKYKSCHSDCYLMILDGVFEKDVYNLVANIKQFIQYVLMVEFP